MPVSTTENADAAGPQRIAGCRHRRGSGDVDRTLVRELDRVADQVRQHLAEAVGVAADHGRQFGRDRDVEREVLAACHHRQRLEHRIEAVHQLERRRRQLEMSGLDLREVEDVVDDVQQRVGRRAHQVQVLALLVGHLRGEQQLAHPDDAVQRCPHFVADVRDELALRAVGRLGGVLRALELHRGALARRDVAADRLDAGRVALRRDRVRIELDGDARSVGPDEIDLERAALARREALRELLVEPCLRFRRDEIAQRHPDRGTAGIARDMLAGAVDSEQPSGAIAGHHHVVGVLEQLLILRAQRFLLVEPIADEMGLPLDATTQRQDPHQARDHDGPHAAEDFRGAARRPELRARRDGHVVGRSQQELERLAETPAPADSPRRGRRP